MFARIIGILVSLCTKLGELACTVCGWVMTALVIAGQFLFGYRTALVAVVVCVVMDAIWGISAAIKRGEYAQSELLRDTLSKAAVYGSVLLVFMLVDNMEHFNNVTTGVMASIICVAELWSVCGNALIVNPKIPFLRLMIPVLRGEIARKLGISEQDVEEALGTITTNKQ